MIPGWVQPLAGMALGAAMLALQACSPTVPELSSPSTLDALVSAPVVRLSQDGIGAIHAGSPYSSQTLRDALPGFTFQTVKTMSEGELKWLIAAFKNGSQQIQFEPDRTGRKIERIHVVGLEAAGPNDERLGMSFAQSGGAHLTCRPGKAEWSSMAVCETPDHVLAYVYAPESYDEPDGELFSTSELAKARLVRMVWHAPTS